MIDDNVLVISYENNMANNTNAQLFKTTLDRNGWKYLFIGEGDEWYGIKTRVMGYYNTLKNLDANKIVVLSDARDVFCLRNPLTFINSINKITDIEHKIIISVEMYLHGHMNWTDKEVNDVLLKDKNFFWQGIPINNYWKYYDIEEPLRKYVNGGLIIGKVNNLIQAFEWIIQNNFNDDQLGFANYCNSFPEKVTLDFNAEILHSSSFGVNGGLYDEKQKYDSPTLSELLGMHSYFLHIPGLNISKGQLYIYNTICKIFDTNIITSNELAKLYNITLNDNLNYSYFYTNKT
jgi:hypothetical protein